MRVWLGVLNVSATTKFPTPLTKFMKGRMFSCLRHNLRKGVSVLAMIVFRLRRNPEESVPRKLEEATVFRNKKACTLS